MHKKNNKTKKATYIPVPGGTDTEKVSNLSIFSNTHDPAVIFKLLKTWPMALKKQVGPSLDPNLLSWMSPTALRLW